MSDYSPEPYWSEVAANIDVRGGDNVIAGDDEPYYVYKRERFLQLLRELPVSDRAVLEIGPGPGGNLRELQRARPVRLAGADISARMIEVARRRLDPSVELVKTDGTTLPFDDREFDLVFSVTVLQHNSNDEMMRALLGEMARVAAKEVALFEQVDYRISGDELMRARPVAYYADIMREYGYVLAESRMLDVVASYYASGAIRRVLNPSSRKEGEPLTPISIAAQKLVLPVTKLLDRVLPLQKDMARMWFVREHSI